MPAGSSDRRIYIVMGVCGAGKSVVGAALAHALDVQFVEGDTFHSDQNVKRMAAGIPLTDAYRAAWLRAIAKRIHLAKEAGEGLVVSCSALKRSYRALLRTEGGEIQFVFLRGSRELLSDRLQNRKGHFMPPSLLDSQLATLEEPTADERAIVCDIADTPEQIVAQIIKAPAE
jgi:gluconokinase